MATRRRHMARAMGRLEPVIACAESHLRIYSTALKKSEPALIFEDDTRLLGHASQFHTAIAGAPDGWDITMRIRSRIRRRSP